MYDDLEKNEVLEEKLQEMKDYYNKQVTPKDEVDKEIQESTNCCDDCSPCCDSSIYCCECLDGL